MVDGIYGYMKLKAHKEKYTYSVQMCFKAVVYLC